MWKTKEVQLCAFSIRISLNHLFRNSAREVSVLHGIKVLSALWVSFLFLYEDYCSISGNSRPLLPLLGHVHGYGVVLRLGKHLPLVVLAHLQLVPGRRLLSPDQWHCSSLYH